MKDLFEYCVCAGFALVVIVATYTYLTETLTGAIENAFNLAP